MKRALSLLLSLLPWLAGAEPRQIHVFVALADNASQGIVPVPAKIGDGNKPDDNLYWGCGDGFKSQFKASSRWKLTRRETNVSTNILERLQFTSVTNDIQLVADAYRGSAIRRCVEDFEACLLDGKTDLVAYIGHNGLMDFQLPQPARSSRTSPAAVVLCCKSEEYFEPRLRRLGAKPVLLTEQLMYPGAFLLHDAIEVWRRDGSPAEIRAAAAKAYAKNQGISVKAASGIFSLLTGKTSQTGTKATASSTTR